MLKPGDVVRCPTGCSFDGIIASIEGGRAHLEAWRYDDETQWNTHEGYQGLRDLEPHPDPDAVIVDYTKWLLLGGVNEDA